MPILSVRWPRYPLLWLAIALFSFAASFAASVELPSLLPHPVAASSAYCFLDESAIATQARLREAAFTEGGEARKRYQEVVKQNAAWMQRCRQQSWLKTQAIWLRLYPCDARPGVLDAVLDRIVARGYNQVYLEVFADGQVLLPAADNPTPWVSLLRSPELARTDLLKQAIDKSHARGLKAYAWLFTMNFGYSYSLRQDRQEAIARNARGQTSIDIVPDGSQVFIDPYHPTARRDYQTLVKEVLERQPDGFLFDYIRYPRGLGEDSTVARVEQLWIFGNAARSSLLARAQNSKGRLLIERYLQQGTITTRDIAAADRLLPEEEPPLWQGRTPTEVADKGNLFARRKRLQLELWYLSVAHAAQGVIDFLNLAAAEPAARNLPTGAVFFPDGNQAVGQWGFDSRLQPWTRFPSSMQWHAMSYGVCGNPSCIVSLVERTVNRAPKGTHVAPVLAGTWGKALKNRPALEAQMEAIHARFPQIDTISHFAYSWQEPESTSLRRSCPLP